MIDVKVVTPNGIYKEFKTPFINITSKDGERGILPNHVPVVFMIDIGKLETGENNGRHLYAVNGGMFYFENNMATILVDSIEAREDIDLNRAEVALKRAMNRIKIAS